jgi:hypothetical protein
MFLSLAYFHPGHKNILLLLILCLALVIMVWNKTAEVVNCLRDAQKAEDTLLERGQGFNEVTQQN